MDRRTHHRLAQPLPPFGQGLGVPQQKRIGVLAPRLNPPHAEKALSKNSMIPDRHLGKKDLATAVAQFGGTSAASVDQAVSKVWNGNTDHPVKLIAATAGV